MPSTKISIPKDTWTNISLGAADGAINLRAGTQDVLLVQSILAPALPIASDNPIADTLTPKSDVKYYYGLVTESIWAWSGGHGTLLVVTPKEQ